MSDTIELFIRNFIQKDRRERCRFLLTGKKRFGFTNLLNHRWDDVFNMKLLYELKKNEIHFSHVQQMLKLKENEPCYIISSEGIDDRFLPFKEAYELIENTLFGSLLINLTADRLYLKTEVMGSPPQFIGHIRVKQKPSCGAGLHL